MRKGLLTMFLLALVGMAGNNVTVMAQTPEPSGQWTFSDPNDLMKASKGNLVLTPAVMGNSSITEATVAEAGITTAEGRDGSSAIFVPKAAALKVARAEGAEVTSNYTFMMDMKVPNAYVYDGLFQTSGGNANDGDLFISKGQIGIGALGGYYGRIWNNFWYRIVFTMSEGVAKVYVNGQKTSMTPKEYDLLFFLVKNRNLAMSRDKLLESVWGYDFFGDDRTVDTHIKMLRNSLGEYRKFIITLRGMGYKFEAE